PIAVRKRTAAVVSGDLANVRGARGSPVDSREGFGHMLVVRASRDLYTVPRSGVHGGGYARSLDRGLRKVLRADRYSVKESALEETIGVGLGTNQGSPHGSLGVVSRSRRSPPYRVV